MTQRSETFYEGKTAPMTEAELGAQIGVAGPSIQRYKAGYIPPESRPVHILATAGVQRGFLARAWLMRFLQAARYPAPEVLLTQLAETPHGAAPALPGALPQDPRAAESWGVAGPVNGALDAAQAAGEESLVLAERLGSLERRATALGQLGWVAHGHGDYVAARRAVEALAALATIAA